MRAQIESIEKVYNEVECVVRYQVILYMDDPPKDLHLGMAEVKNV